MVDVGSRARGDRRLGRPAPPVEDPLDQVPVLAAALAPDEVDLAGGVFPERGAEEVPLRVGEPLGLGPTRGAPPPRVDRVAAVPVGLPGVPEISAARFDDRRIIVLFRARLRDLRYRGNPLHDGVAVEEAPD